MFETDESTELISPVMLALKSNEFESLESNIIDFSNVEYLNVSGSWLTDEAVNLGNFKSLHTLLASDNLLSYSKIAEIDEFNKKFE
jgi:Leucine-rich repeat (LRR) protein